MNSHALTLEIAAPEPLGFELSAPRQLGLDVTGFAVVRRGFPEYDGPVVVVPGEEVQTLATAETSVLQDIVVGAIPSNYGRIDWDGNVLSVY